MKVVILAGGYGTRISEESAVRPKPMVEIDGRPLLWHVMKIYSLHGVHEFIICCGYKGHQIKEYFANYALYRSDLTIDLARNRIEVHANGAEPWRITLVDTGERTMTGGRIKRVREHLGETGFLLTYGDGVSNVDIPALIDFHRRQNVLVTLTAVQPPGRFGAFNLHEGQTHISNFREKPKGDDAWINGGFFVVEPGALDFVAGDDTVWEEAPLRELSRRGQLAAYRHEGFWQSVDSLRDKMVLEAMCQRGDRPWLTANRGAGRDGGPRAGDAGEARNRGAHAAVT